MIVSVVPCSFEVAVNRMEDTEHVVIPVHLREKYKQSGYNHTSTPLFGQPFLITVPRTLSEDKLYNLLLLRLWSVTPLCRLNRPNRSGSSCLFLDGFVYHMIASNWGHIIFL